MLESKLTCYNYAVQTARADRDIHVQGPIFLVLWVVVTFGECNKFTLPCTSSDDFPEELSLMEETPKVEHKVQ